MDYDVKYSLLIKEATVICMTVFPIFSQIDCTTRFLCIDMNCVITLRWSSHSQSHTQKLHAKETRIKIPKPDKNKQNLFSKFLFT